MLPQLSEREFFFIQKKRLHRWESSTLRAFIVDLVKKTAADKVTTTFSSDRSWRLKWPLDARAPSVVPLCVIRVPRFIRCLFPFYFLFLCLKSYILSLVDLHTLFDLFVVFVALVLRLEVCLNSWLKNFTNM